MLEPIIHLIWKHLPSILDLSRCIYSIYIYRDIKERVLIVKNKYFLREGEAKYYEWDESKKMKIGAFARSKFINSIEFCDYRTMTTFSKSAKPLV